MVNTMVADDTKSQGISSHGIDMWLQNIPISAPEGLKIKLKLYIVWFQN